MPQELDMVQRDPNGLNSHQELDMVQRDPNGLNSHLGVSYIEFN